MKISIDANGRKLHELIERPLEWIFYETCNFKHPIRKIDIGRAVCVEHGPLLGAGLSGRYPLLAVRVRTDDDLGIIDLFRFTWIGCLILGILKEIVEKTHDADFFPFRSA